MNYKKILGILVLSLTAVLSIVLVLMTVSFILTSNWSTTIMFSIIWIAIIGALYHFGKKLYSTNSYTEVEYIEEINQDIIVNISEKEYIKLNFIESYSNPVILFSSIIGLGMLYVVFDYLLGLNNLIDKFPTYQLFFGVSTFIGIPIAIFLSSKKIFKTNKFINETITYHFDTNGITANGESFNVSIKWNVLQLINEHKDWYVLMTGKNQGYYIPKKSFKSINDEVEFKQFLNGLDIEKRFKN